VYEVYFYPDVLKSEGWLKKVGEDCYAKKTDIIYFSASPNCSAPIFEEDKTTIHENMELNLKNYSVSALDTGSAHAGIFLYALEHLPANYTPKMVVIDLTLRSFSNVWIHSGLENSMQRNLMYWNNNYGLYNKIQTSLKNYSYIPFHERNEITSYDEKFKHLPFKDSNNTVKLWFDSLTRLNQTDFLGREYVRNFGFILNSKNEMLAHFDKIVKLCKAKDIELVFLILPENIQQMDEMAGKNLRVLCHRNVRFLKNHFKNAPVKIIDLHNRLGAEYFYEPYPTEHFKAAGRKIIGEEVAKVISKIKINGN
jgi:hypothetical protein